MPNHVYQLLEMVNRNGTPDSSVAKLVRKENKEEGVDLFDVDAFFPMPEELRDITVGACMIDGEQYREWRDKPDGASVPIKPEERTRLLKEYGASNWYDWAHLNWGTKWAIYNVTWHHDSLVYFQSAWSPATKIIKRLSTLFPEVNFILKYADEGGDFIGESFIANGEAVDHEYGWDEDGALAIREKLDMLEWEE